MTKTWLFFFLFAAFATGIFVALLITNLGLGEKRPDKTLERLYSIDDPQFRRSIGVLLGPAFLEGNSVETLLNGDRIFAAMLEAIYSAKKSITFETYVYWDGSIGKEFAAAFAARASDGVKVHVMIDWLGSADLPKSELDEMGFAGVQVERFHQPHWSHLARLNNRTHRKLLVVDGTVGFTGGVGIADNWRGNAEDSDHWRDTHFRVAGPVVAQMQAVFNDNWSKATGRVLHGDLYFPLIQPVAQASSAVAAQVFSSSPTGGAESMHLMYLMAITAASKSIALSNAYFVPDRLTVDALVAASQRGVAVRIITPGDQSNSKIARRASRALWEPLLTAGVLIAEFQPTMYHCKVLVVDGLFVSVGSTNFDNRSFRLNDEANLNILDASFAGGQLDVFEADLRRSRSVSLKQWRNRPLKEHLEEWLASLVSAEV